MFSQSLLAQLSRWLLLLLLTLFIVNQSPTLLKAFADQAQNAGCHQHPDVQPSAHRHH